ncbi:MAG: GSCFA domain-containing protein [Ekhidna sp.]
MHDKILLMGSCFSDEIGSLLAENKFNCLSNPFGTIYNPYSIFKLISDQASSGDVIESQGVYYHWDAHGAISGLTEQGTKELFKHKTKETQQFIRDAKWLIITLGTAHVYELSDGRIVANCHKIDASKFHKRLLRQDEIVHQFKELHSHLTKTVTDIRVLFTISPVRHIRDGLVENNQSKAILIDAVRLLVDQYENVDYFPSYEILIDELRDYRFFSEDMVHPSRKAIHYIWQKFVDTYFKNETIAFLSDWQKIKTALQHKPFQPESDAHQQFLKATLRKLEKMNEKVDVTVEIELLKNQIL